MKQQSLILALAVALAIPGTAVLASSHREAPYITEMPKVDGTDFYMFRSYETGRAGYVTLVANYLPLQAPYGGPNYFSMDPDALYEIHVDNNGDAREDLTFQFRFQNTLKDITLPVGGKSVSIPLIQAGAISAGNTANLNVTENYTVDIVRGDRRQGTRQAVTNINGGARSFIKPVDNIGNKTIADYPAYAAAHIYNINIPGCSAGRMFVGQRKDPFVVNLGEVFDLINISNPIGAANVGAEVDQLNDANVTSLVLEVPVGCLTAGSDPVIGAWTTASVRQARLVRTNPSFDRPAIEGGPWIQVSRLGMPLVNEVVIGLKDKNRFNFSRPVNDASQFADYVTNPTLPMLVEILFPSVKAPTNFPRNDLIATFLTGLPTINRPAAATVTPAEMLRLNTLTAVTQGTQNNLGVLGGDAAGFPNGRRPGDDVVDIELRVAMGILCALNNPAVFGCVPSDVPSDILTVGGALTDGALVNDTMFDATFPYLRTPLAGSPSN